MKLILVVLCALSFGLAACGGDDDNGGSSEEEAATGAPEPAAPLDEAVAALNESIANQDCEQIMELTFSTLRESEGEGPAEPDQEVLPQECAKDSPANALLSEIEGTTFESSEEWGPAAISDGPTENPVGGYDNWTVIWLVDRDGQWRHTSFFPADPQIEGEDLPAETDAEAVTQQFVDAIQAEDCSNAEEFIGKGSRFGATPEEGCEALLDGAIFAPTVQAAEEVTVEELGRSRDYAVVGIDTGETYFSAQLATAPIAPDKPQQTEIGVIDVLPQTEFEYSPPKNG